MTARRLVPLVSGLLFLVSCQDEERMMEPAYRGRDSLGIEIVTVHRPSWSNGEGWQVRQAPGWRSGKPVAILPMSSPESETPTDSTTEASWSVKA